jgi:hypothetical protein
MEDNLRFGNNYVILELYISIMNIYTNAGILHVKLLVFFSSQNRLIIRLPNLLIMSVQSRNVSCALKLIYVFLLLTPNRFICQERHTWIVL